MFPMGRLAKSQLARLITLAAASCTYLLYRTLKEEPLLTLLDQLAAAIHGFIWPQVLWKGSYFLVDPVPIVQSLNLGSAILILAWEWPCWKGHFAYSIKWIICIIPVNVILASLFLQGINAALYYFISVIFYYLALLNNEVINY